MVRKIFSAAHFYFIFTCADTLPNVLSQCSKRNFIFLQTGTYCQQRELEAITEWVDSDGGIILFNCAPIFSFGIIYRT